MEANLVIGKPRRTRHERARDATANKYQLETRTKKRKTADNPRGQHSEATGTIQTAANHQQSAAAHSLEPINLSPRLLAHTYSCQPQAQQQRQSHSLFSPIKFDAIATPATATAPPAQQPQFLCQRNLSSSSTTLCQPPPAPAGLQSGSTFSPHQLIGRHAFDSSSSPTLINRQQQQQQQLNSFFPSIANSFTAFNQQVAAAVEARQRALAWSRFANLHNLSAVASALSRQNQQPTTTKSPVVDQRSSLGASADIATRQIHRSSARNNLAFLDEIKQTGKAQARLSNCSTTTGAARTPRRRRRGSRKCRKVYGMAQRPLWCKQCKWKKACSRFTPAAAGAATSQGISPAESGDNCV